MRAKRNMSENRPSGVTIDNKERTVSIKWSDDHDSIYAFDYLRAVCPCAECKGNYVLRDGLQDSFRNRSEEDLKLDGAEAVGAYAIRFRWSDRHTAGIYSWEMLRNGCRCDACTAENKGKESDEGKEG